MTKIVCDYAVIARISDNINNSIVNMYDNTNKYQSTIMSDLSSWQGEAKTNFNNSVNNQVANLNNNINLVKEMLEHLQESVKQIEMLDDELATLTI